jgi:hypothetical protein
LVNAGYVNVNTGQKLIVPPLSEVSQCGEVGPLLSNIYLHEFDLFMEGIKKDYTQKGRNGSKTTIVCKNVHKEVVNARTKVKAALAIKTDAGKIALRKAKKHLKTCMTVMRKTPSKEKSLTKVYYVRYVDD